MAWNTGATFVPGGEDTFYMPEVIAPAPHRAGEHPNDMRQNVANMEQEAQARNGRYSVSSASGPPQPQYQNAQPTQPQGYQQQSGQAQGQGQGSWNNNIYSPSNYSGSEPVSAISNAGQNGYAQQQPVSNGYSEVPNFSPFPKLRNPGPNIPPTDEQKEQVLANAREAVLACNDPEQQLTWAQDALNYVEISIQNEQRISRTQAARPRTPRIEHLLREDATKVVNFLADQRHPRAEFIRGMWYEFGKFGFPVDKPESFQCYKRSSERGYARAWYRMGMQFESGNDPLKAIKYYKMAADAGDSAACYRLGMMTLLGQHGQLQDYEYGLQLIYAAAHAADENAPQGAYVLGMLQAGELPQVTIPERYLKRSISSAKLNVERAAFLGFAKAQVRMGSAYELGELHCDFDPVLSLHYNALAARQGEVDAEMSISKWFLCGQEGVFEKNEEMAFTYAQRAAIDGLPTAQFAMGYFYEVGIHVATDLAKAKEWYQKADESGNKDAAKRIEAVARSNTITRKDHERVAIQRIQSQRGTAVNNTAASTSITSSTAPQLPPIPSVNEPISPTLNMPDPSKLSLTSTAPAKPVSSAPYPTDQARLSTGQDPNYRPTSAFGINPNLQRPVSTQSVPTPQVNPYINKPGPPPSQRPYSGETLPPGPNYGRDPRGPSGQYPPGPYGQQHPPPRTTSASPHISPRLPSGPSPQGGVPRPAPPHHANTMPAPAPGGGAIGFVAPIDVAGADRPNWAPHMSGAGEGPRYARKDSAPAGSGRPLPSQQGSKPTTGGGYQALNRPVGNQAAQPRPPPQDMKQNPGTQGRPSGYPPQQFQQPQYQQQQQQQQQPLQQRPPPPAKISAAAAATKPPGKGPKTFEEMGVPVAQKESDCVVM